MCAVLIAGQLALGWLAGVEIVTVLLLCFSVCFGAICGVITAVAFSLLRCLIWGFYPAVVILYLIYYPLFALVFGLLGKIKAETYQKAPVYLAVAIDILLLFLGVASGLCAGLNLIKVNRLYRATINALLWVISGICGGLLLVFNVIFALTRAKKISGKYIELFLFTTASCVLTVCFTLLDDVISPLILGMTRGAALGYFYASFTAMLPQVVCAAVTVFTLYYPITFAFSRACPDFKKDLRGNPHSK